MDIRLATNSEIKLVKQFYDDIIDGQAFDEYSPRWTKDVYPSINDITSHIENNEMYIGLINNEIASAGVITFNEDPIYVGGNWTITNENDVSVIHLFATSKKYRGTGISGEMLDNLINIIKNHNKKTIHLDVMLNNVPAEKIYLRHGFKYIGNKEVYYEDTGNMEVELFEYII